MQGKCNTDIIKVRKVREMSRFKVYDEVEFIVLKEDENKKLVQKENNKFIFLNNQNIEKRNFTFSINDHDREDKMFMEFIFNQEDFNSTIHYLILNWIKEYGSENIKLDRFGNLIQRA